MHLPVDHQTLLGDFQDEDEGRMGEPGTGSGETSSEEQLAVRGKGGCIRDRPVKVIPCPRCQSMNTKFCYYNNYSVTQPRHFCRNCQRYWTVGGTLRNVPVGGGSRKKMRTRSRTDPYQTAYDATPQTSPVGSQGDGLLSASSCMRQLSMLPPTLGFGAHLGGFSPAGSQLPFLQSALEGLYPRKPSAGVQEVPDLQSLCGASQIPQTLNSPAMLMNGSFFTPDSFQVQSQSNDALAAVMAKVGLWSSPMQTLPVAGPPASAPGLWEDIKGNPSMSSQLQQLSGYGGPERRNLNQATIASALPQNPKPGFWEAALMHSRPLMDDRLVPRASWDENLSTTHTTPSLSPNGSSTTDSTPNHSFSHGYEDVSQPWAALHASDILF